jgi:hypothetical protein
MLDIVSIAAGVTLLVFIMRDIFTTLLVPFGEGRLSHWLSAMIWNWFRRSRRSITLAGPMIPVIVILSWTAALVVGWALVYLPFLPDHFQFADDLSRDHQSGLVTATYFSLVSLTTLGFGDIYPDSGMMRVVTPIEALMGFAIITAGLTWFISVYSVLSNQRGLARQIGSLREAERRTMTPVERLEPQTTTEIYSQLTARLIVVHNDLVQFPTTYYFHGQDNGANLSSELPYLLELARRGQHPIVHESVRFQAAALSAVLEGFTRVLADRYFDDTSLSCEDVIARFQHEHEPGISAPGGD